MSARVASRALGAMLVMIAAALGLAALAHAAQPFEVQFSPALPSWHDTIRITVEGDRETACDASTFALEPVTPSPGGPGSSSLFYQVVDRCELPTLPRLQHIVASAEIGQLAPGDHLVSVDDHTGGPPSSQSLTVYDVGGAAIELPAVVRDDAAARAFVACVGTSNGTTSVIVEVEDPLVKIVCATTPFPITPPPAQPVASRLPITLPKLAAGDYDLALIDSSGVAHASLRVWAHAGCLPDETTLCLGRGRFRVTATWRAFDGSSGTARALPLAGNDGSGLLWFFDPTNAEITIKVLDGCALDGAWWVFLAAGSNVSYEVTVEDTTTGATRVYDNPLGRLPPLVTDVTAFGGCG